MRRGRVRERSVSGLPRWSSSWMAVVVAVWLAQPDPADAHPWSVRWGARARTEPIATQSAPAEPSSARPAEDPAEEPAEDPAEQSRGYLGPTAVRDEPGRSAVWTRVDPSVTPSETPPPGPAPTTVTPTVPPPSSVRDVPEHITLAIGLGPQAPGTREEKSLLEGLESGLIGSVDPTTEVRRLRPGMGARRVCRDRRDDLVVMVGYVADRATPVLLPYDCALDRALGIRAADAASDPRLASVLWDEHQALIRQGVAPRRPVVLGPRARRGIIAGAVIIVVGGAVGVLVANALREESVVITVHP